MSTLPAGTVTFLFSDIEGSTQALGRHPELMGAALARHHALYEEIVTRRHGAIFETVGDAVYAAFARPVDAVAASLDAHRALAAEDWGPIGRVTVRIAVHTGEVERRGAHYFGPALFRCARLQALGYGEQTLLSSATAGMVGHELPQGATLLDLGQHLLKDLAEPERVFQLAHPDLRAEFPQLKSIDRHPHNLPIELSSFVGRETELREIGDILAQTRLLTLTGPGGVGKTRLALHAAGAQVESFADGVFLVELAAIRDSDLVLPTIAGTLGLREPSAQDAEEPLESYLRDKELLLVVDNVEQVTACGPALGRLLGACEGLRIIATGRQPLHLRGEREYAVSALDVPGPRDHLTPGETSRFAAIELFEARALAVLPSFRLTDANISAVGAICARLDGLPLAIELAAARVKLLPPEALVKRLEQRLPLLTTGAADLPARQRTLRAAIAWSHELLAREEQEVFTALGVFAGGFDLAAAQRVTGINDPIAMLDGLDSLIDKSLVRRAEPDGEPRFGMFETIREFARERLGEEGRLSAAQARHLAHFAGLSENAEPGMLGSEQAAWFARLDADLENLRAAMSWALETDGGALLRITGSLWRFWRRGYAAEGRDWCRAALSMGDQAPRRLRARTLFTDGELAFRQHDLPGARRSMEPALEMFTAIDDQLGMARARNVLANVAIEQGDKRAALDHFDRGVTAAQASGNVSIRAVITGNMAVAVAELQDDLKRSLVLMEAVLADFRAMGDQDSVAKMLLNLSLNGWLRGDHVAALGHASEGVQVSDALHDRVISSTARLLLGLALIGLSRHGEARSVMIEGWAMAREIDDESLIGDWLNAVAALRLSDGSALSAARLWGAAESRMAVRTFPAEQRRWDSMAATARAGVNAEAYDAEGARGRAISLDEATEMATHELLAARSIGRGDG